MSSPPATVSPPLTAITAKEKPLFQRFKRRPWSGEAVRLRREVRNQYLQLILTESCAFVEEREVLGRLWKVFYVVIEGTRPSLKRKLGFEFRDFFFPFFFFFVCFFFLSLLFLCVVCFFFVERL